MLGVVHDSQHIADAYKSYRIDALQVSRRAREDRGSPQEQVNIGIPLLRRAPASAPSNTFGSLTSHNFRLFIASQVFSYTGGWVQRIAQDWLVLSLTGSATAVGITVALQFLPSLLFSPYGGVIADRYPKRRVMVFTTSSLATLAGLLGVLTMTGHVQVGQVYLLAFLTGTVIAIDNPTRRSFVTELVPPAHMRSAIGLDASIFQLGALAGPAGAGLLISALGPGFAFVINALSFAPPLVALPLMRASELHVPLVGARGSVRLRETFGYVGQRPAILWPIVLAACFSFFTMNLAVTLATYARTVAASGAGGYGYLTSTAAAGALAGALLAARRSQVRLRAIAQTAAALAVLELAAGLAHTADAFSLLLVGIGLCTVTLFTSINSTVQINTGRAMRGRVMGVYLLAFMGAGALGGPAVGYADQHLGAQSGLVIAGTVGLIATAAISVRLAWLGHLRLALRPQASHRWTLAVVHR
jgi:MFS family permease